MTNSCLPRTICFRPGRLSSWLSGLLAWGLLGPLSAAQLALIIDDVGARHDDPQVFALPQEVTLSFLPHTPWGRQLALRAWREGRETLLHLPMATTIDKSPGPWAIGPDQDQWQVQYRVKKAFADIPFTVGVNNHMGSAITGDIEVMGWVMAELHRQQQFFIDSRTVANSQAYAAARAAGLPSLKRDVFLDPMPGQATLKIQWRRALNFAQTNGSVVVIGHPYPDTLEFLQQQLPLLSQQGITLVRASALLSSP
ncbi:divergent polysaccharide deacetylase family protein [Ferrimonas pelagia]|uniref:Divergent polysaccharide deacetylase family protein n=1 Tax=Ferrimonas pelagia TaxID=1177826 RepID=A0ABP9EJ80_9GAMM